MAVAANSLFVAERLGQCLSNGDADVFDRVMGINVQIALRLDVQVDHPVPGHLLEHVVKERHTGGKPVLSAAIKIQANRNPGFQGVSGYLSLPHDRLSSP